jgi:hypothetical protein
VLLDSVDSIGYDCPLDGPLLNLFYSFSAIRTGPVKTAFVGILARIATQSRDLFCTVLGVRPIGRIVFLPVGYAARMTVNVPAAKWKVRDGFPSIGWEALLD